MGGICSSKPVQKKYSNQRQNRPAMQSQLQQQPQQPQQLQPRPVAGTASHTHQRTHGHGHGHHAGARRVTSHHYHANQHAAMRRENTHHSNQASNQLQAMVKKHGVASAESIVDGYSGMPEAGNIGNLLGEGATGKVYRIAHRLTGKTYACKVVALPRTMPRKQRDEFIKEVDMIKMLDHPNTVKVTEVFEKANELQIVMEECTGGELFDKLYSQPNNKFSEVDCKHLMKQMLRSIAYLHANDIAHRDLKLENFLFSSKKKDATIKVIDFGFSATGASNDDSGHHLKKFVGTCYYMAPEVISRDYGHECDLWSMGVLAFMLMTGEVPFNGEGKTPTPASIIEAIKQYVAKGQAQVDSRISQAFRSKRHTLSEDAIDFVQGLLQIDIPARMTASGALGHEWFAKPVPSGAGQVQHLSSVNDDVAAGEIATERNSVVDTIMAFRKKSIVQRSAFMAMSFGMSNEDLASLGKTFCDFDKDSNGVLSLEEFTSLMQSSKHGKALSVNDIENAFGAIDQDGQGSIQYSEFIASALMASQTAQDSAVEAAFQKIDLDGGGTITTEELKAVLPPGIDAAAVENILRVADADGDGRIDKAEFKALISGRGTGTKQINTTPSFSDIRSTSSTSEGRTLSGSLGSKNWGTAKSVVSAHSAFLTSSGGKKRKVTAL